LAGVPARPPSRLSPFHHEFTVRREDESVHSEIKPRGCGPTLDTMNPLEMHQMRVEDALVGLRKCL
jgi:hypothetical protein